MTNADLLHELSATPASLSAPQRQRHQARLLDMCRDHLLAQKAQVQELIKLTDIHNAHADLFRDPDHPEAQRHHGVVSGLWLAMDKLTDPTPPP